MDHDENPAPLTGDPTPPPIEPIAPIRRSKRRSADRFARGLWNWVLPIVFLMSVAVLAIYAVQQFTSYWRITYGHAEAEVAFQKRRAELKAEAEHADERLELLDKKVHLTSLGFREVARKVLPVVVNVANYRMPTEKELADNRAGRTPLAFDPDDDQKYVQHSVGSGLIVKPAVILTNFHVVRNAQRLRLNLPSGRSIGIDPKSIVADEKTDLAIIRLPEALPTAIKEEVLQAAEFADSDKDVQVGEWVLAMGSPLGLKHTVTHGIISAKGRLLSTREHGGDLMELLQTDAAIHPGNSGGPLFDLKGRVVGINVMIASDTGLNQGIGFAIPSNTAKRIAETLLDKGEVPRGYLGVEMVDLPAPRAKELKIDDGGVIVKSVLRGSPAEKAGLQKDDIIVRVNKELVHRHLPIRHVRQIVSDLDPGTDVNLEVVRGEERRHITVTLGKQPSNFK